MWVEGLGWELKMFCEILTQIAIKAGIATLQSFKRCRMNQHQLEMFCEILTKIANAGIIVTLQSFKHCRVTEARGCLCLQLQFLGLC